MGKFLAIPVHVDALYLRQSEAATAPTADFRKLPYFDHQAVRDVNSDSPWLGDSAASRPFENSNLTLQHGIHLHWALPDGLCHGNVNRNDIEMPTVPNRWLIRRRYLDAPRHASDNETWVIESDYLWPLMDYAPAVNIFRAPSGTETRPYRYLGRKLKLDAWLEGNEASEYLENLTALGHGDPSFAAFYPNCMSVFGFHDRDLPDEWNTLQYDITGWYQKSSPSLEWQADTENAESQIEADRGWRIEAQESPQQILCYASIQLTKSGKGEKTPHGLKVAVGNTASEALSALLAREIAEEFLQQTDNELVAKIEEQLEALYITGQLSATQQDWNLQLQRYRHQKSFESVSDSPRWTIQTSPSGAPPPPTALLQNLHELNRLQTLLAQQLNRLQQARRQLYGDWCHYMRCAYRPPDGGKGQFLDLDEVATYIETRSLANVNYFAGLAAKTQERFDEVKGSLKQLLKQLNQVLEEATQAKQAEKSDASQQVKYALKEEPGARYWQPADPVVLLAGDNLGLSDRHGRDGRFDPDGLLQCHLWESKEATTEKLMRHQPSRDTLLQWIEDQFEENFSPETKLSSRCIGFQKINVETRPWNAVFLDWGVDLHPAESHSPVTPIATNYLPTSGSFVDENYSPDIIINNYQLGSQKPDLQLKEAWWIRSNPDRFSGQCIVTDTPVLALKERIEEVIKLRLLEGSPKTWAHPKNETYWNLVQAWYGDEKRPKALPKTQIELDELLSWYQKRPQGEGPFLKDSPAHDRIADPFYCILQAYRRLFDVTQPETAAPLSPRAFFSQTLSGFHGELLQWKSALSLPIADPIGFTPYQQFSEQVAEAVQDETVWTTEPTNNFSPIRSGALKLDRLRLIDSFGQVAEVACGDRVIVPSAYQAPGRPGVAFLPPRLVQPARVTFRWLDASADHPKSTPEMVEAAGRSPICGWLLPERVRGRLLVFDGHGQALGAIAADNHHNSLEWVRAPGLPPLNESDLTTGQAWLQRIGGRYYESATRGQEPEVLKSTLKNLGELGASLQNQRLARVLLYLLATQSQDFLEQFLDTLDDAITNIDPEGTTSMGSLALLVGRPVAVVGAELNLHLQSDPAVRQDWGAFFLDQYRHYRDTDDFTQVEFRLRLGQYQSCNDGVLGYWLEDETGFVQDTFTAQAADDNDPTRRLEITVNAADLAFKINAHDSGDAIDDLNFTQSVGNPALRTTLLFDPRGQATLTTGILPVKQIDIPRSLWEPALEAIRLWLPVGPILTPSQNRVMPTPTLVGYQWRWLEMLKTANKTGWQSFYPRPTVDRTQLQTDLDQLQEQEPPLNLKPPEIEQLIAKSWLAEMTPPGERLYVLSLEDRQPLDDWAVEEPLEALLAHLVQALIPPQEDLAFTAITEVREGWLLLEPAPETAQTQS